MNFAESLSRVNDKLDAHERRASAANLREEYEKIAEFLAVRLEAAGDIARRLEVLHAAGAPRSELAADVEELAGIVVECLDKARKQPERLEAQAARLYDLPDIESRVEERIEETYQQLRADWIGTPMPDAFRLLTRSGALAEALTAVQRANAQLPSLLPDILPSDPARLVQARQLKEERDAALAQIEAAMPADVAVFLRSLATGRASLAELTPDVLLWLVDQGIAAHIRMYV